MSENKRLEDLAAELRVQEEQISPSYVAVCYQNGSPQIVLQNIIDGSRIHVDEGSCPRWGSRDELLYRGHNGILKTYSNGIIQDLPHQDDRIRDAVLLDLLLQGNAVLYVLHQNQKDVLIAAAAFGEHTGRREVVIPNMSRVEQVSINEAMVIINGEADGKHTAFLVDIGKKSVDQIAGRNHICYDMGYVCKNEDGSFAKFSYAGDYIERVLGPEGDDWNLIAVNSSAHSMMFSCNTHLHFKSSATKIGSVVIPTDRRLGKSDVDIMFGDLSFLYTDGPPTRKSLVCYDASHGKTIARIPFIKDIIEITAPEVLTGVILKEQGLTELATRLWKLEIKLSG